MHKVGAVAMAAGLLLLAGGAQAQSADDGQKLFKRSCAVCHTVEQGKNRVGPSLFGIYGRPSGSLPDFKYSEAMKSAGWTWDAAHLDTYLTSPKTSLPGNKMIFAGVKKDGDRSNLIAYLETIK